LKKCVCAIIDIVGEYNEPIMARPEETLLSVVLSEAKVSSTFSTGALFTLMTELLTVDITDRCNLECDFCYQAAEGEISGENVLDLAREYSPEFVCLGGGEPTLREDLPKIVKQLVEEGYKVHLSTNGVILIEAILDISEQHKNMIAVQVNLPSVDAETYIKTTKNPVLEQVLHNIEIYQKRGLRPLLRCVAYRNNYLEGIRQVIHYAKERGLTIGVQPFFPIREGTEQLKLSTEELMAVRDMLFAEKFRGADILSTLMNTEFKCLKLKQYYGLGAGNSCEEHKNNTIYVAPDLTRSYCEFNHKDQTR